MIVTSKHDEDELARWLALERQDAVVAQLRAHRRKVDGALHAIERFAASGPFYAGVSWGKDSVCLADLVFQVAPATPLVWIRIEPVKNPECLLVRDAFLGLHPGVVYHEEVVHYEPGETAWTPGFGPEKTRAVTPAHTRGFRSAARALSTDRYCSGIRAEEACRRRERMQRHGYETARTCAPLGWWTAADVFAHLFAHGLPVHPAYAYTMRGAWNRDRLRVDALWGPTGQGSGRRAWEAHYYPDELRAMERWCARVEAEVSG